MEEKNTSKFIENNESNNGGIPETVFKAFLRENVRFPQSFAFISPALVFSFFNENQRGVAFEELFFSTLSDEQNERLAEAALKMHSRSGVMSSKDESIPLLPYRQSLNEIWDRALNNVYSDILSLIKKTGERYADEAEELYRGEMMRKVRMRRTAELIEKIKIETPREFELIRKCAEAENHAIHSPEGEALAKEARNINNRKINPRGNRETSNIELGEKVRVLRNKAIDEVLRKELGEGY